MSRLRLTPEVHKQIVSYIRSGCYEWLAAEAAGVPRALFEEWLRRGLAGMRAYRAFAEEVSRARAQARARAEIAAFEKDPGFWLRHGPGRETSTAPGWSGPVRPLATTAQANALESLSVLELLQVLDEALRSHPEARAAVLQAIDQLHPRQTRSPRSSPKTETPPENSGHDRPRT